VSPPLADLTMHRCPPLTHVVCVHGQSITHGRILSRLIASGKDGAIHTDATWKDEPLWDKVCERVEKEAAPMTPEEAYRRRKERTPSQPSR
jgi:hypothetical protein